MQERTGVPDDCQYCYNINHCQHLENIVSYVCSLSGCIQTAKSR